MFWLNGSPLAAPQNVHFNKARICAIITPDLPLKMGRDYITGNIGVTIVISLKKFIPIFRISNNLKECLNSIKQ